MSDELPGNLRPVANFFGLPGTAPVAKDFHVVRAIRALAALDAAPFALVFGGGTALARAHKLVRRMSEDADFKIVPLPAAPVSRSGLHRQRSALPGRVTAALQAAGFSFDPKDPAQTRSRDESSYMVWHLLRSHETECLRPADIPTCKGIGRSMWQVIAMTIIRRSWSFGNHDPLPRHARHRSTPRRWPAP